MSKDKAHKTSTACEKLLIAHEINNFLLACESMLLNHRKIVGMPFTCLALGLSSNYEIALLDERKSLVRKSLVENYQQANLMKKKLS